MKKIGIDARLMNETGVGTYIRNLLKFLPKESDIEYVIYDYDKSPFRWHSFSEQINFLKQINHDDLDLMHFTYFSYPYFYKKPFIITIHDLTPYLFKTGKASTKNIITYNIKHAIYKILINNAIRKSKAIITPTETVKNQIVEMFGCTADKIFVTYEGVNNEIVDAKENLELEDKFGDDYFLYVGNFYPHKNVELLVRAFAKTDNQKLILVGRKDYFFDKIFQLIKDLHIQDRVLLYEKATAGDLKYFYKNAKALIFPSLSEGFGLPIIEAAYFKCPVICSDIKVFREIAPDNKYFFNPKNIDELVTLVNNFDKIDENSFTVDFDRFSFASMARETFKIFKKYL